MYMSNAAILRVDVDNRTGPHINQSVGTDVWQRERGGGSRGGEWATIRTEGGCGGASGTYTNRGREGGGSSRGREAASVDWRGGEIWVEHFGRGREWQEWPGSGRPMKRGRKCLWGHGPAPHGRGDVGGKWCLSFEPRAAQAERAMIIHNTCRLLARPTRHDRTDRDYWREAHQLRRVRDGGRQGRINAESSRAVTGQWRNTRRDNERAQDQLLLFGAVRSEWPLALARRREPYNRSVIPRLSLLPLPAPANAQSMPSILNLKFKVGLCYMRTPCTPCSHPCLSPAGK